MSTAPPATPSASKPGFGDFVWHEPRTPDAAAAEDFYTHVVGWRALSAAQREEVFSAALEIVT